MGRRVRHDDGGAFYWGSAHAFQHLVGHFATRVGVEAFVPDYDLLRRCSTATWPARRAAATEMLLGLAFHLGFVHRELLDTPSDTLRRFAAAFAALYGRALARTPRDDAAGSAPAPTDEPHK